MKRAIDILVSMAALIVTSPLFLIAVFGIRLSSPGPVFYRATRVGRGGLPFTILKLRTMHVNTDGPKISALQDARIFRFGSRLRKFKIDELPQFINVLRGDMSVVGPRPEDPEIVATAYTPWMQETLSVRPGMTSPAAVFFYSCGSSLIDPDAPEESYVKRVLPAKLAIERAYMERATILSDFACMICTAAAIVCEAMGKSVQPPDRDMRAALKWVPESAFPKR
jgi:lipopolysaccharide/colanic/teichoic acid biosynthesis glycosyltransferase